MSTATISYGPKLGLLNNAAIGEQYYDQFRPFLRGMDSLVQCAVINSTTTSPPSSPSDGDSYLLLGTPSGVWTGHANDIAVWSTQVTSEGNNNLTPGWDFYSPKDGWQVFDVGNDCNRLYKQGNWLVDFILQNSPGYLTATAPDNKTLVFRSNGVSFGTNADGQIISIDSFGVVRMQGTSNDFPSLIVLPGTAGSSGASSYFSCSRDGSVDDLGVDLQGNTHISASSTAGGNVIGTLGGSLSNSNVSTGVGAGTGATVTVSGRDGNHQVTLVTGTSLGAGSLFSLVFASVKGYNAFCTFSPASASAAQLSNTNAPFMSSNTTTGYTLTTAGSLAASTTYVWNVNCV